MIWLRGLKEESCEPARNKSLDYDTIRNIWSRKKVVNGHRTNKQTGKNSTHC